jgi:hypothetical protein
MLKPIILQVDETIADAYNNASDEHREAVGAIVSLVLQYVDRPGALEQVVKEICLEASANGLKLEHDITDENLEMVTYGTNDTEHLLNSSKNVEILSQAMEEFQDQALLTVELNPYVA